VLVLFDHGTPKGLVRALSGLTVQTAQAKGWETLSNGALLTAAEEAGFELLLTTDRRIRYQQNLRVRRIALVVLTGASGGPAFCNMPTASLRSLRPRRLAVTPKSSFHSSRNPDGPEQGSRYGKRGRPVLSERTAPDSSVASRPLPMLRSRPGP
jgi:hypothetical protein